MKIKLSKNKYACNPAERYIMEVFRKKSTETIYIDYKEYRILKAIIKLRNKYS